MPDVDVVPVTATTTDQPRQGAVDPGIAREEDDATTAVAANPAPVPSLPVAILLTIQPQPQPQAQVQPDVSSDVPSAADPENGVAGGENLPSPPVVPDGAARPVRPESTVQPSVAKGPRQPGAWPGRRSDHPAREVAFGTSAAAAEVVAAEPTADPGVQVAAASGVAQPVPVELAAPDLATDSEPADSSPVPAPATRTQRDGDAGAPAREAARKILATVLKDVDEATPPSASAASGPVDSRVPADPGSPPRSTSASPVVPAFAQAQRQRVRDGVPAAAAEPAEPDAAGVTPQLSVAWTSEPRGQGGRQDANHGWRAFATTAAEVRSSASQTGAAAAAPVFLDAISAATGTVTTGNAPAQVENMSGASDVQVARQVVRAISLAWRDDVGEARVLLNPEHLGEVSVAIRVERGAVTAVLQAETASAREWIRAHETDLRHGLESQGLELASLVVSEEGNSRGGHEQPQPQGRRRAPARAAIGVPVFEVEA
jgi:flagellar hook-length control protein FliK